MNTILTKETILAANDLPMELVEVPEWGGSVYVRTMNGAERDKWEIQMVLASQNKVETQVRAMVAALTVCDAEGKSLFTMKDIEALSKKSAAALDRVVDVAARLNHIRPQDVEGLQKNS